MNISYDAQHNEYCAYVLPEAKTPYGMLLGNLKSYAQSTGKGGIRGLWDADTDRIIFGTHQMAYRLAGGSQTYFPHQVEREFTFLPYAQLAEFTLDHRVNVAEAFYVPHGPAFDRSVSFVVDVTLYNPTGETVEVSVFPWALLVGQRFYGEPENEVRAQVDGDFIRSVNQLNAYERWWGASRTPHASVVSLREQALLQNMRRGTLRPEQHQEEVTPAQAEWVSRRIYGAFEYRLTVAPGQRESLRIAVVANSDGPKAQAT
ncbi:MAG: hypothetical protein M3R30_03170, partial [Candidatus Eremiobacteraeota bacterium]|nr:hypothetical protein [Candidatus Eremiobacteraeota bacterium]